MSLEQSLAVHTAALEAHGKVVAANTAILERVVAGQTAAIDRIDAKVGATPAKAATPKPAAAATPKPEPEAAKPKVTDDDVKGVAVKWMDGKSKEDRAAAATKLNEILAHFGRAGEKLTGPESKLSDDERQQARFYIQRWAAGHAVDFNAEYDFDGDPAQGAAAAEADPLG